MKHLLISCLAGVAGSFCLATTVAAQEPPLGHSLTGEAWALQFGIANNLSLRDFQGTVISAKHHRSSERAVRYGLSVFAEHMNGDTGSPDRTRASVGFVAHFWTTRLSRAILMERSRCSGDWVPDLSLTWVALLSQMKTQ